MFCRLSDTVGSLVPKSCFTPLRQSEAIFVELTGPNITYLKHLVRGVVEHPKSDSCVKGGPGASAKGGSHAVFHTSILDIWVGRDL